MEQDTCLNTERMISMSEQSETKTSIVIELACQATTVMDTAPTPGLGMRQGSPAETQKFTIGSSYPATGVGEKQGKVREAKQRL
jgi:hypothetical protein